jgi:hypothetical protein
MRREDREAARGKPPEAEPPSRASRGKEDPRRSDERMKGGAREAEPERRQPKRQPGRLPLPD